MGMSKVRPFSALFKTMRSFHNPSLVSNLKEIFSPVKNIPAYEKPLDASVRNVFIGENEPTWGRQGQ